MAIGLNRFEGRLFAESGTLFLVVQTDEATGVARVSFRVNDDTQVIEMPITEVARRVSAGASLILDNLNSPESARRIVEEEDGWYFSAREGQIGPFQNKDEAGQALGRYILSMQSVNDTPRERRRSARPGSRRQSEVIANAAG